MNLCNAEWVEARDLAALERLAPRWQALWQRCPWATPFQHPAWLIPWWRHLGEGRLRTLALGDGERLALLAPLYVFQAAPDAPRRLLLLGSGNSDYTDILADPGLSGEALGLVCERLADARPEADGSRMRDWDVLELHQLRAGNPLAGTGSPLLAPPPPAWRDRLEPHAPCPVLAFAASPGADSAIPNAMAKKLRYYGRLLQREAAARGGWRIEAAHPGMPEPMLVAMLGRLFDLHARRWRARGEPGVIDTPALEHFHREAARGLLDAGLLDLRELWLGAGPGARVIASYYGLHHGARACYYLGAIDPEFQSLSPGTLLLGQVIAQFAQELSIEFDFLRGTEDYKYRWGAVDRATWRRELVPPAYVDEGSPHARDLEPIADP